jgi:hypothetical protein
MKFFVFEVKFRWRVEVFFWCGKLCSKYAFFTGWTSVI